MNKLILFIILWTSIGCFAQPGKDSLLLADRDAVLEKLSLMFYLDNATSEYHIMTKAKQAISDRDFPQYYAKSIVKNNPTSLDINEYLREGSEDFKPEKWSDFIQAVYGKNITEFIAITEKYGYISFNRQRVIKGQATKEHETSVNGQLTFVSRHSGYDKMVRKIIKKELKIGNMPQGDYTYFKFALERKTNISDADIAKLERSGIKFPITNNPK